MNFFLSDGFFSDICMSIDIIEVLYKNKMYKKLNNNLRNILL